MNIVSILLVFMSYVILRDSVMSPIQFLWINLIMDTFAALALASEPPSLSVLERWPQPMNSPVVNPIMMRNIVGQAIY